MRLAIITILSLAYSITYAQSIIKGRTSQTITNTDTLIDASLREKKMPSKINHEIEIPQSPPQVVSETIIILNDNKVISPNELSQINPETIIETYSISAPRSKNRKSTVIFIYTKL